MIYAVKLPGGEVVPKSVAHTEVEALDNFFLIYGLAKKFSPSNSLTPKDLALLLGVSVVSVQVAETTVDA